MKTRIAAVATLAAFTFAAPVVARAQDRPPPVTDTEDQRLDEALRRAYGDPNYPALPEPTDRAPDPRVAPPPPAPSDMDKDDDDFKVRVGAIAAEWAARLMDASVRSRAINGSGSDSGRVKIDDGGDHGEHGDHGNRGFEPTQTYRGWIDLGRWFSIQGGGRHVVFRDDGSATQAANGFTFGSQSFAGAYRAKLEITSADLDLAFHPVMCEWGQLDLTLGARYIASTVQLSGVGGQIAPVFAGPAIFRFPGPPVPGPLPGAFGGSAPATASQSIGTAMPMIGVGGTFRPVHIHELSIELYARARIGGIAYGNDQRDDRGRGGYRYDGENGQDRLGTLASSFEGEVGVSILLFQVVGITGGYHFEVVQLEKTTSSETRDADWKVGGPFLGLVAEF